MEHIPAIHAAKVGMRYPARVHLVRKHWMTFELDLSAVAPGRKPTLYAHLDWELTVKQALARTMTVGQRAEIVLIGTVPDSLLASLPAESTWLTWNNGTVRQLARRIRETRETVLMPVLADALEEAGCTDTDLLAHCRQPPDDGSSWAVDLLATQE
jgi:hypothetical protein